MFFEGEEDHNVAGDGMVTEAPAADEATGADEAAGESHDGEGMNA